MDRRLGFAFVCAWVAAGVAASCRRSDPAPPRDDAVAPADATRGGGGDAAADPDGARDGGANDGPDASAAPGVAADAGPPPRRVTVLATGDIDLHPRIVELANAHRERGRLGWVLGAVAPLITPRDVALADLETPLSVSHRVPGSGPRTALGAPAPFARDLARLGFDAFSVATNRAYDQTADGLDETVEALRAAGLGSVGAGRTDDDAYGAWVAERDGVRVAVLGCTVRTDDGPGPNHHDVRVARLSDPSRVLAAVTAARGRADVVAVMVHWARDYARGTNAYQARLARRLVDAGADLVLGAGSHFLGPVARVPSPRGEAVVAYSLGNLVSNHAALYRPGRDTADDIPVGPAHPGTRDGALLRVTFDLSRPGTVAVALITAVALWTRNAPDEVRVVPLRALDLELRGERLRAISAALGPAVRVRP